MKLNLVGIGPFSSQIAEKLSDEDTTLWIYNQNMAGLDLESNELAYLTKYGNERLDLSDIQETFCFVDCNQGIAGITLSLLERFADKDITVFMLIYNCQSDKEKINQKITYNVLQEYARSGVLKGVFILNYDKLFDYTVNNMPDNDQFSLNDVNNNLIDKLIFGVHIYWRLNNETYMEGEQITFQDTIYRIKTFFELNNEADYMYGDMLYVGNKIIVKGLKQKMQKQELLDLQKFKKVIKDRGDRYILLNSEFDFVLGIAESKIVQ